MSFYVADEEPFVKKITSIKDDALYNGKITLLRFLNMREVELIKFICGNDLFIYVSGSDDLEYNRVMISPFEVQPDFKIKLLHLTYNKKYLEPNHRMILGALMNLGINRDTIGDILITNTKDVYIYATEEIASFIIDEFRLLAHQSITLEVTTEIKGKVEHNYDIMQDFVISLRLDLIIAQRYNLTRNEAQEIIKKGDVKVNQKPIDNTSHMLHEGDLISIKGYGRMKLLEVGGLSKSNRIHVKLAKLL